MNSFHAPSQPPILTKADLRAEYPLRMLQCSPAEVASYHESSGTTGQPTAVAFTEADWNAIVSRFLRSGVKLTKQDWVLIKTPYSLVTTAHQMERAARRVGATVVPADNRSANMPYRKVLRLLRDLPISVVWCMPTEACLWARLAIAEGLDPKRDFPNLRAFWVAGEPLSEGKRQALSSAWGGIPVFRDYGSTETGSLAGDCAAGTMHLWSDELNHEIWDEKSKTSCRTGDGQLLVTLRREAIPLVRYNTEDSVTVTNSQCLCGSSLLAIDVHGRSSLGVSQSGLEHTLYCGLESSSLAFWRARVSNHNIVIEVDRPVARDTAQIIAQQFDRETHIEIRPDLLREQDFLRADRPFLKPRYVFNERENWDEGLHYQRRPEP